MTWAVSSMTKQILKSAKCLFLDEDLLMKPCLCILLPFPAVSAEIALITASLSHFIMSFYFFPPFIFFFHTHPSACSITAFFVLSLCDLVLALSLLLGCGQHEVSAGILGDEVHLWVECCAGRGWRSCYGEVAGCQTSGWWWCLLGDRSPDLENRL